VLLFASKLTKMRLAVRLLPGAGRK